MYVGEDFKILPASLVSSSLRFSIFSLSSTTRLYWVHDIAVIIERIIIYRYNIIFLVWSFCLIDNKNPIIDINEAQKFIIEIKIAIWYQLRFYN